MRARAPMSCAGSRPRPPLRPRPRPLPRGHRRALSAPAGGTHREAPRRVHLDHAAQQALAVGRDEVRHVEHAPLHLLQQLPQVVVVEGQRPLRAGPRHRGAGRRGRGGDGGAGGRAGRGLTTSSANRITPQLHTSALRPSYFSPCGQHCGCRGRRAGVLARTGMGESGRSCPWAVPGTGRLLGRTGTGWGRREVATYPDHLRAGIVGGSEGKSGCQGRRLRTPGAPSHPALGPLSRRTPAGGDREGCPPHTLPGMGAPLWGPQAHQEATGHGMRTAEPVLPAPGGDPGLGARDPLCCLPVHPGAHRRPEEGPCGTSQRSTTTKVPEQEAGTPASRPSRAGSSQGKTGLPGPGHKPRGVMAPH